MARCEARGQLSISANWTFFASSRCSRLMRYERILVEIVGLKREGVILSANFRGNWGRPLSTVGVRKLEKYSPWAIMWRCLRDPMFSRSDAIPTCDRDTHRHTTTASIASAAWVTTMWEWYYSHLLGGPQWGDRFEFWRAGSHRWHNHPCQISWQSVQGFWSSDTPNFAILHRNSWSPLQQR